MNDLIPINVPAAIDGDLLTRHRYTLFPGDAYQHVGPHTPLMSTTDAEQCAREMSRRLAPMTRNEGLALTEQLLSYFPNTAANHEPKAKAIFLAGLLEILLKHSLGVGQAAVKWVRDNRTFLHHADLAQACEQQTRDLRIAHGLARAHIEEAERRARPISAMAPDEKAEIAALLAHAAERLRRKSANRPDDDARRASLKAMTDEEFKADTLAMLARMQADEPAYRARMAKANAYVLGLKARGSGAGDR